MANWISSKLKAAESILQQVPSSFLLVLMVSFLRIWWEVARMFDFLLFLRSLKTCRFEIRLLFWFLENRAADCCVESVN